MLKIERTEASARVFVEQSTMVGDRIPSPVHLLECRIKRLYRMVKVDEETMEKKNLYARSLDGKAV